MTSVTLPISRAAMPSSIDLLSDAGRLASGLIGNPARLFRVLRDLADGGSHLLGGGGNMGQVGGGLLHSLGDRCDIRAHFLGAAAATE